MNHQLLSAQGACADPTGLEPPAACTTCPATIGAEEKNAPADWRPVAPPDPAPVLIEVAGDTGLVLWQALRDVIAWAATADEDRAGVFGPGAAPTRRASLDRVALPTELAVPVSLLADLVANPAGTSPLLVMHACLRLARHLCWRGAGLTGLAFAQAAALAAPVHPRPLLEVGRLLGPARVVEAATWLQRAAELAAERTDSESGAEIHAELAVVAFRCRDRRAARGHLLLAARATRRQSGVR